MKKKPHQVKCSSCGRTVGSDPVIKVIEKCLFCTSEAKKSKPVGNKLGAPKNAQDAWSRARKGPAEDLPEPYCRARMRSGWERNFARVLVAKGIDFSYEERVFMFGGGYRSSPFQYIPDFHENVSGIWWEIKGYLDSKARQAIRRFKKEYPVEFGRLHICLSRGNKKAISFYLGIGIPEDYIVYIEDLKAEWKGKVSWE